MADKQDSNIPEGVKPKSKEAMLHALSKSLGVVTPAIRMVGISRKTHYNWLRDDAEYAQLVSDTKEESLDFSETKLLQGVAKGNMTAVIFHLKTQGKQRGYVERVENVERQIHVKLNRNATATSHD